MKREVLFYKTANQTCPVEEFLNGLQAKKAQKIIWTLCLLEELEVIPVQYFCKMPGTENIWECRVRIGSDIYRVFTFWDEKNIVLTHV